MEIGERALAGRLVIERYGNGGFRVGGEARTGSILLRPDRVVAWPVDAAATIDASSFEPLFAGPPLPLPVLVLLGTGVRLVQASAALRAQLRARGAALEVMDTGAACRTYNVLLGEGRQVAAALIAV